MQPNLGCDRMQIRTSPPYNPRWNKNPMKKGPRWYPRKMAAKASVIFQRRDVFGGMDRVDVCCHQDMDKTGLGRRMCSFTKRGGSTSRLELECQRKTDKGHEPQNSVYALYKGICPGWKPKWLSEKTMLEAFRKMKNRFITRRWYRFAHHPMHVPQFRKMPFAKGYI